MMEPKPFLYGILRFEDQARAVIIKQGLKYMQCLYLDGSEVRKARRPITDLTYFIERGNSDEDLRTIKRIARMMKGKNSLSATKRTMTKAVKEIINEILT